MGRREYDQACSLASALDRIGERWSLLIVRELSLGPLRFSDLDRNVGNAPTDILTKRLRDLESHGIVRRRPLDPPATGFVYELTEIGWELERPMIELGRWGMNFERAGDVSDLPPSSLANAVRLIVQPSPQARMTVGLRSGDLAYTLRVEDGWVAASRGLVDDPDLVLSGEPAAILVALVVGEAGAAGIEIEGDRAALDELRAMVVLPAKLRQETLAFAGQPAAVA
ncbi:MAG TPA: winged helix-turn-helix transcriptional regulator [Solirubrobacterales bacterium]